MMHEMLQVKNVVLLKPSEKNPWGNSGKVQSHDTNHPSNNQLKISQYSWIPLPVHAVGVLVLPDIN